MIITDEQEIMRISDKHMQRWPLYAKRHTLLVHYIPQYSVKTHELPFDRRGAVQQLDSCDSQQKIAISFFNTESDSVLVCNAVARWTANIIGDVFYLLSIHLPNGYRGKGYGDSLYMAVERIAADVGCRQIRQTPSGNTSTGETRQSYLNRRGWSNDGIEVFKSTESIECVS